MSQGSSDLIEQGNHWTVFNGAGAVVADNMPLDVVHAYLTPARFARGWMAAYCITVRTEDELAALGPVAQPVSADRDAGSPAR